MGTKGAAAMLVKWFRPGRVPASTRRGGYLRPWPIAPAVFNLNNPAHYVHWHFFQMSVANITVIVLMIVVFVAAILIPFPTRAREP